jgi:Ca2+-binding EF-hand superfamily protein
VERHCCVVLQEFQRAILHMWDVKPLSKGYRKFAKVAADWFDIMDVDGSGSITFDEFKQWYLDTIREAQENDVDI